MNQWVDFRAVKQSIGIEQVLAAYRVELKRVGNHQLRGPCPLPTHGSEPSRQSFSVDTAKKVWACHSASCCERRQGRVGGNVLDLVALLEGCTIRDAALRLQHRGFGWRAGPNVCEYQPYWYAYHPKWDSFLAEGKESFFVLSCMDRDEAFAVPFSWLQKNKNNLNMTDRGERSYWHVPVTTADNGALAINMPKVGTKASLGPYRFQLKK